MTNLVAVKHLRIWLGGSFDPVHVGHVAIIGHIADTLHRYFSQHPCKTHHIFVILSLLPTAGNPLKTNPTAPQHRLAMLNLALQHLQSIQKIHSQNDNFSLNFTLDTSEISQTLPVFTFNTLSHFRNIYPNDSLIFVLGMDSILNFDSWYRGNELPDLCHLWVMPRLDDNSNYNQSQSNLYDSLPTLHSRFTSDLKDILLQTNGKIYLDMHQIIGVSSSQIRALLANLSQSNQSLLVNWLLPSVLDYIFTNGLYGVNNTNFP